MWTKTGNNNGMINKKASNEAESKNEYWIKTTTTKAQRKANTRNSGQENKQETWI